MNRPAPELQAIHWFNTPKPITLEELKGRVVVIEAFQMLCPGCVSHGLPQAQRIVEAFNSEDVVVLGLHTVFEHHEAQGTEKALAAFLHEYRIKFPVALDAPGTNGPIPQTMAAYQMQGTPTLVMIDREGGIAQQHFGRPSDLVIGAEIMALVQQRQTERPSEQAAKPGCDESGCAIVD